MDNTEDHFGIEQLTQWAAHKKKSRAPKKVGLYLTGADMSGFVRQNVVAAALVRRFPRPHVFAVYRPEPPSRRFIAACNPYLHATMEAPAGSPVTIPIDWFDKGYRAPVCCPEPFWKEQGFTDVDVFLMPGMLRTDPSRLGGLANNPPAFRLPPSEEPRLLEDAERAGLDRSTWFACIDAETLVLGGESFLGHLTQDLKGQIVRLGPNATAAPCPKGVVDLAGSHGGFELQCAALSRARFVIGCGPDLLSLASAFAIACAGVNLIRFADRLWNAEDIVLTKRLRLADGRELDGSAAYSAGFLQGETPPDSRWLDRTPDELIAIADRLAARTADISAWRPPGDEAEVEKSDVLALPLPLRDRPLLNFWDVGSGQQHKA